MMKRFNVLITKGEDGFVIAEVVGLPGCLSQGRTREEAIQNIKEALEGYIEVLQEKHNMIPRPDLCQVEIGI